MWLLHETHSVRGEAEDDFDALLRDALALRDQWQSRLLRTTRWSPLASGSPSPDYS